MKCFVPVVLALGVVLANPASAAAPAPATVAAAPNTAHVQAVQDLLAAMQIQKSLWSVAGRSSYQSEAQRKAVFAKIDKTTPADVVQRLARPVAQVVSLETAIEMTRFYNTPYGKQVIYKKYNGGPQIMMPGMKAAVAPEEKKERQRPAYVKASKELADAEPVIDKELFKLLQEINRR